ncbi:MAG: Holliday junction branch migration protein RuvA [Muribaculaceae bacterium]|nr:Holliday junction branch migration protein RuvA [Muribaculaceae bacterium]
MLDYIKGTIAELTPTYAVLDNHGMGYMLNISLTTYNYLQPKGMGGEGFLYVYESIREDAHVLFGFAGKRERELFLLLISVSGVGPNTARMILSSLPPQELEQAIASGNVASMKSVKGVGAKTAQRIIVDLKDKIKMPSVTLIDNTGASNETFEEALAALVMLGFSQAASQKALKKLFTENPSVSVEDAIKRALKMM